MLRTWLFVLSFTVFSAVFGVLWHAPTANAWASTDPSNKTKQEYIDFIDTQMGGTVWRDANTSNYAIFWTASYPDDFFLIYGHNNTATTGSFQLTDSGAVTYINGYQMCRWNGDLSGGAGCNPGGSANWGADNIYYLYANADWQTDPTNGAAVVNYMPLLGAEDSTKITPTFKLKVEKKHGVITFRDADATKNYKYAWSLAKFTDTNQAADAVYVTSGVSEAVGEGEFDVDLYGKYLLGVKMCPEATTVEDESCTSIPGTGSVFLTLNINGQVIDIDTGEVPGESPTLGDCSTDVVGGETITACASFQDSLFSSCMMETFPFVDFGGCVGNIGKLFILLSFGAFTVGDTFEATPCKQLSVVDDWMNLNSPTVCPLVPETVRTVTTPFVTCALGLMMISFITRQTRERF